MVTVKEIYDAVLDNNLSKLAMKVAAKGKLLNWQTNCTRLRVDLSNAFDINDANARFVQHLLDELEKQYQNKPVGKRQWDRWQEQIMELENREIFDDVFFCFVKGREKK